jgi:hypothetical protein
MPTTDLPSRPLRCLRCLRRLALGGVVSLLVAAALWYGVLRDLSDPAAKGQRELQARVDRNAPRLPAGWSDVQARFTGFDWWVSAIHDYQGVAVLFKVRGLGSRSVQVEYTSPGPTPAVSRASFLVDREGSIRWKNGANVDPDMVPWLNQRATQVAALLD